MSKKRRMKGADAVDLDEQLREAFRESGLSRFELARRAGLSYAIVHRWYAGERDIVLGNASKIASVLGVTLHPVRK